ncbi:MAG: hypothetical protein Q7J73_09435 [Dehalococcoidales bacterium]|nr:hypothetical protein [Dehalococcoidales bacterium]
MTTEQFVEPKVSRRKFEREIREYHRNEGEYRKRGWLLVEASFPHIFVVMCATKVKPSAVITGVSFDFTNYDALPPSVRLVNPFTGDPYKASDLPTLLKRQVVGPPVEGFQLPPGGSPPRVVTQQPLMQSYGSDDIPFLCIAGVREYHEHPAHSGDAWELHRASGAGRLIRLLEVIDTYGVRPISGYNVELVPRVVGFIQSVVPE